LRLCGEWGCFILRAENGNLTMLQELYITNFVLIDKVTIKLCERLNVFSGATGVGKSLVIGALNFILGGRMTSDVVRSGKDEATVIGKFYVKDKRLLKQIIKVSDNQAIEDELLIQRSIDTSGRSRCRINDVPITVTMLKEIGEMLVNIQAKKNASATTSTTPSSVVKPSGQANSIFEAARLAKEQLGMK